MLWWVTVFDAQPAEVESLPYEVDLLGTTRDGQRLAGRAVIDCVTPSCHYVGLRGVRPLLWG